MALIVIGLIVEPICYYQTGEYITITVSEKEVVHSKDNSTYLIYTEGGEVLENSDLLFCGKFNSSDFQAKLKEGETYVVKVYGWRIPFLSRYRNIAEIQYDIHNMYRNGNLHSPKKL
jgi:hypothetical protein